MKRLMFLGVFLLFCCGVVSSANADVCCTISYNYGNKTEHTANSCTALGGLSNDFPLACSDGVCDVADGGNITCAAGLTKCCVYDARCGNTNYLKCSCVVDCKPCNGVQSEKQYTGTNGCTNYQIVQCKPSYSEKQTLNRYDWIQAVVTTQTTACSKGCYLVEGDVCNKCPGDRTTDGDKNSSGLASCKLNCDKGLGLTAEKDSCVCDSGWYGKNKICEKCPDGFTSEKGVAETKADCFLSGGKYEDEKGWFETTSNCYYDVSRN